MVSRDEVDDELAYDRAECKRGAEKGLEQKRGICDCISTRATARATVSEVFMAPMDLGDDFRDEAAICLMDFREGR